MRAFSTTELRFNEEHGKRGQGSHHTYTLSDACKATVPEAVGRATVYKAGHQWMKDYPHAVQAHHQVEQCGISHIAVLPNAEALDVYEMPHGFSLTVGAKTSLNAEWLQRPAVRATVVCAVQRPSTAQCHEPYYEDQARREALQEQVAQKSAAPLGAGVVAEIAGKRDSKHWEAALEGAGQSWVGVYRDQIALERAVRHSWSTDGHFEHRRDDPRRLGREQKDAPSPIFVVASCTAPSEMHAKMRAKWRRTLMREEEEKTQERTLVGDRAFLADEERLAQAAYRNACRLAYQAAEALHLDVQHAVDEQSIYAAPDQKTYYTPPRVARPDHVQVANMAAPINGGKTLVSIDSGCATFAVGHPYNTAIRHQGGIRNTHAVIAYGPQQGMALAPLAVEALQKSHTHPIVAPVGSRRCMLQKEAEMFVKNTKSKNKDFAMPSNYLWEGQDDKGKDMAVRTRFLPQRYEMPDARFEQHLDAIDRDRSMRYLSPMLVKVAITTATTTIDPHD